MDNIRSQLADEALGAGRPARSIEATSDGALTALVLERQSCLETMFDLPASKVEDS